MFSWFKKLRIAFLEKKLSKINRDAYSALASRDIQHYNVLRTKRNIVEAKINSFSR